MLSIVESINNSKLTVEHVVLALRTEHTHNGLREIFKNAGLSDVTELDTFSCMVSQLEKILKTERCTSASQVHVTNDQQAMMNSILMGIAFTPATADTEKERSASRVPSKRRRLQFLNFHVRSGFRKMKHMEQKQKTIRW